MEFRNYNLVYLLVFALLFYIILFNYNLFGKGDNSNNKKYNFIGQNFLKNSYAIEATDNKDKVKKQDQTNNKDSKETDVDEEDLKITRENQFLIS